MFHSQPCKLKRRLYALIAVGALSFVVSQPVYSQWLEKMGNPKIPVTVNHPPKLALSGITKIAISDITGECGLELTDRLTEVLLDSGRFEVLNRTHLQSILNEHNFNFSGMVDTSTAAELGRILGPAAMIFGRVTRCNTETQDNLYEDRGSFIGRGKRVNISRTRAKVVASLQLVELTTARIYAAQVVDSSIVRDNESSGGRPVLPDPDEVLSEAYSDLVSKFTRMILPWSETVQLVVYDDKKWELKQGAEYVKLGELERAAEMFQYSIDQYGQVGPKFDQKMASKAYYNLGIALMYSGRAKEGLSHLEKAFAIRQTDISRDAITTCKEIIRLDRQLAVKEASAITLGASSGGGPSTAEASRCSYCNAPYAPGAKFCNSCGKKIEPKTNLCHRCQAPYEAGAKFCAKCGAALQGHR